MTPTAFRAALLAFRREIGQEAYVSAGITSEWQDGKPPLDCSIYPNGITKDKSSFTVYAENWAALLDAAKSKWAEYQVEHKRQSARKLALAIIRITAETGQCTDAALRYEFGSEMVDRYGDDAVADANKIAANGPFEIIKQRGANGAPADAVERNPARVQ
jgi:hypothetical protein